MHVKIIFSDKKVLKKGVQGGPMVGQGGPPMVTRGGDPKKILRTQNYGPLPLRNWSDQSLSGFYLDRF